MGEYSLRLKDYDYRASGTYFMTICTARRARTLWNIQEKGAVPKKAGRSLWQKGFYEHVIRDASDYNEKNNTFMKIPYVGIIKI